MDGATFKGVADLDLAHKLWVLSHQQVHEFVDLRGRKGTNGSCEYRCLLPTARPALALVCILPTMKKSMVLWAVSQGCPHLVQRMIGGIIERVSGQGPGLEGGHLLFLLIEQ